MPTSVLIILGLLTFNAVMLHLHINKMERWMKRMQKESDILIAELSQRERN